MSAFKYDRTYFDNIVSSVGPLMEKLTTGKIAELISPDYLNEVDSRPIFEWLDVIRRNGIVYVGLDALTDTTVASAVGTLHVRGSGFCRWAHLPHRRRAANQGRKVFTLQRLPACEEPLADEVGKVAGFSLHAGVAARADERKKLERLCRTISRPAGGLR